MDNLGEGTREDELFEALRKIGRLTRWVGWLEGGGGYVGNAGRDMREIQKIASEATGLSFEEYT